MDSNPSNMAGIADLVAKAFTELKQDMDKIIVETTAAPSPKVPTQTVQSSTGQQGDLPAVHLHGRTESESVGYDDYALPSPAMRLPEALQENSNPSNTDFLAAIQAEAQAAGTDTAVNLQRRAAVATDGSQDAAALPNTAADGAISVIPTADGPCRILSETSMPEAVGDGLVAVSLSSAGQLGQQDKDEKPLATSQLSYKELLNKALGGYDPRLAQQMQASLRKASPERRSPSPQRLPAASAANSSPGQSKFPSGPQPRRTSGNITSPATPGSLRIFKSGSGSAQKLLEKQHVEAEQRASVGGAAETLGRRTSAEKPSNRGRRARSAPREEEAETAHVRRFTAGSNAADAEQNPVRSKSNPRGASAGGVTVASQGYIDRLYNLGKEKQKQRAQVPDKRSLSPVRLTEEEWKRVSNRLYSDARLKEERMQMRKEREDHAIQEARHLTTGGGPSERMHTLRRSAGAAGSAGGRAPDPGFYGRQMALLAKRAEWASQRRPRDELTENEQKECTFHPEINNTSRELLRSVADMEKWDLHRKLHVMKLEDEKSSREFEGYTFMPEINDLSRKIALQHYAAAPDPNRPWTASPVHTSAPDMRQYSPPRSASPRTQRIEAAAASRAQDNTLRHSIAGPHLYYAAVSPTANAGLMTAAVPFSAGPAGRSNPRLWSAPAAAAGLSQSVDASLLARARQQQQADELPPGVVMGIPVAAGPAGQHLPEDAVVIQMPNSASGAQHAILSPVAPGDGVAFVRLGAIKTVAPAGTPDSKDRQVISPVQAQIGLEQGLGSGEWQQGGGPARVDDSAANTPMKRGQTAGVPARVTRAFRDDSAGGTYVPQRKGSAGGAVFSPVMSTQKASASARPGYKLQDSAGGSEGLQPTLSDATRAALELSQQLGIRQSPEQQVAGYAAAVAARQQQVPAYYVAMDSRDNSSKNSNSYSKKYEYSKAAKGIEGPEHMYPGVNHGDSPLWGIQDPVAAAKAASQQEWQQQQQQQSEAAASMQRASSMQRAASMQKYSTAQLFNARNRSSIGGLVPAAPVTPTAPPGQQQLGLQLSSQVLPGCDSAIDAAIQGMDLSQLGQQAAQQQAEGLLNQTQSRPFELLSPGSRLYLNSSSEGGTSSPGTQQMMQLLATAEEGGMGAQRGTPTSHHQQQQPASPNSAKAAAAQILSGSYNDGYAATSTSTNVSGAGASHIMVHNLLRPAAGSPFLPDSRETSRVGTPVGSSNNLLSMMQRNAAAAALGGSKLSSVSKPHLDVAAPIATYDNSVDSPTERPGQQWETASHTPAAAAQSQQVATTPRAAATVAHSAPGSPSPTRGIQPVEVSREEGNVSAADVLGLLFDSELTPEAKAQRMAKIFSKTLSKRNIQFESLQQTLEAVSKAASLSGSAAGSAAPTPRGPAPAQQLMSSTPAASAPGSVSGKSDTLENSENIQQLLLRMSAQPAAIAGQSDVPNAPLSSSGTASPPASTAAQAEQPAGLDGDVLADEAGVEDSWCSAVDAGGSACSSSSGGSSGRAACRITQFASVPRQSDQ